MNYYNYFTEIEEHFVRRRGKHMFVSPMDWSLIATWRESGVPLHVALRGIDIAMDTWHNKPRRDSDRLSTLFYCHDSVMAEFERHLETHLGEDNASPAETKSEERVEPEAPDKNRVMDFLDARIREIKALREKHSLSEELARVLGRLEEIAAFVQSGNDLQAETLERDLGILNDLALEYLKSQVPPDRMAEWQLEAKGELKVYRKRLPKETYQKILDNFLRSKIHQMFNVGELSLFHLS